MNIPKNTVPPCTFADQQAQVDRIALNVAQLQLHVAKAFHPLLNLVIAISSLAINVAGRPGPHRQRIPNPNPVRRALALLGRADVPILPTVFLRALDVPLPPRPRTPEDVGRTLFAALGIRAFVLSVASSEDAWFAVVV